LLGGHRLYLRLEQDSWHRPEPDEGMSGIVVGTSSWTDKTLLQSGRFYPPDVKSPEARLAYYAQQFGLVEVDTSYYALPRVRTAEQWAERTPADFVFDVKAFRLFTGHPALPRVLPVDIRAALGAALDANVYLRDLPAELVNELWRRFRAALEPLARAGKLGAVLLQFAPWIVSNRDGRAHVEQAARQLEGFRVAVEFRNKSWFSERARERVLAFERERGICHVVVDEPQGFASSVPQIWQATNPALAILRLHGRNREMWTKKGLKSSAERFDYAYSTPELATLAESAKQLAGRVEKLHVLFNNCYQDKAQRNAVEFAELLEESGSGGEP
jgi:uncharacterized protein YecE (DUF72 family)